MSRPAERPSSQTEYLAFRFKSAKKDSAAALPVVCSTDRQPSLTRTFCPDRSFHLRFFHLLFLLPHVSKILDCERENKARCYAPDECETSPRSRAAMFTQRVNICLVQPLQRFTRIHGDRLRSLHLLKHKDQRENSNERTKTNPTH